MKKLLIATLLVMGFTAIASAQYGDVAYLRDRHGANIAATMIATAGSCTSEWYNVSGIKWATIFHEIVDTSTAGTTDSINCYVIAQHSWGPTASTSTGPIFFPDSMGTGRGDSAATYANVGNSENTTLAEADTFRRMYDPFNINGAQYVRFLFRNITARNPQATRHWIRIRFQKLDG
jgi:hypothetical protein